MDTEFRILTNSVQFNCVRKAADILKYLVTFTPELASPRQRCLVMQQFWKVLGPTCLFDDLENVLYLACDIETLIPLAISAQNQDRKTYTVIGQIPHLEDQDVQVSFTPVNLNDAMMFHTVLVRKGLELLGLKRFGDGMYDTRITLPEYSTEINFGIRFGVRDNDNGIMLWLEPSSVVWRSQKTSISSMDSVAKFEKSVKSQFIFCPTREKCYLPVHDVRWDLNPLSKFDASGIEKSFVDYYRDQYGIEITDLSQPLLITKSKRRTTESSNRIYSPAYNYVCKQPMIMGEEEDLIINIPELCRLSGLLMQSRLHPSMGEEIQKHVCKSPKQTACIMKSYLKLLHSSKSVSKLFRRWNVEIDSSLLEVQGHLLPGPRIRLNGSVLLDFGQKESYLDEQFNFKRLAGSVPVYASVPLLFWTLVCSSKDENLAIKFLGTFSVESKKLGLEYKGVAPIHKLVTVSDLNEQRASSLGDKFVNAIRDAGTSQLIVIMLPRGSDGSVYHSVKQYCCRELGVPSQAIKSKSVLAKGFVGIVRNIILQIVCKLGGAPWSLESESAKTDRVMTVGIDTYHDRRKEACSVFSAVFTLNSSCTKYYTRTVRQTVGQETGDCMTTIFYDACIQFYKENGCWPSKVIVFRDGVSNFYLNLIKDYEVAQIKRCLDVLTPRPKLLVLVIQKHTTDKFMLLSGERILSPTPGTVVDSIITRTEFKDFFLVSQLMRGKGGGQPIRCVVIEDDIKDFDYIQKITYESSFTYFNWAGSIRIPAVCQYAHKAASFVGTVLKNDPPLALEPTLYYL